MKHLYGFGTGLLIFLSFACLVPSSPLESDARLKQEFERGRETFRQISSMALDDEKVATVTNDYVMLTGWARWFGDNQHAFSMDRWMQYKQLFEKLGGINVVSVSKTDNYVEICCGSVGVSPSDNQYENIIISKSFVFSSRIPSPMVDSLDELGFESASPRYRRIEENWYLKFDKGVSKPE
jgi:hypothetical protein